MYTFSKPIDTSKFPPLSSPRLNMEGDFVLKFVNQDKVVAKNGTQFIEMEFEVVIGPHAGMRHNEQFYVFNTDADKKAFSMRILASVYRALNGGDDGAYIGTESIGKCVMVTRQQDGEYEGRPNYNSRNWRPAPSVDVTALPPQSPPPPAPPAPPSQPTGAGSSQAATAADDLAAEDVPW